MANSPFSALLHKKIRTALAAAMPAATQMIGRRAEDHKS